MKREEIWKWQRPLNILLFVTMPLWFIPVAMGYTLFGALKHLYEMCGDAATDIIFWWKDRDEARED